MQFKKGFLAVTLALVIVTQGACTKSQVVDNAQFTIDSLSAVQALWPAKAAVIAKGLGIAQQLLNAVEANGTNAVLFIEQMIPVSKELASDANLIKDAGLRTSIILALSGLDIGLHFLARFYNTNQAKILAASSTRSVIMTFDVEPVSTLKTQEQLKRESKERKKKPQARFVFAPVASVGGRWSNKREL